MKQSREEIVLRLAAYFGEDLTKFLQLIDVTPEDLFSEFWQDIEDNIDVLQDVMGDYDLDTTDDLCYNEREG